MICIVTIRQGSGSVQLDLDRIEEAAAISDVILGVAPPGTSVQIIARGEEDQK